MPRKKLFGGSEDEVVTKSTVKEPFQDFPDDFIASRIIDKVVKVDVNGRECIQVFFKDGTASIL